MNDDNPQPNADNPTLGRRAGYHLDENGDVSGLWFTIDPAHFFEFNDVAVTDPEIIGKNRKPSE